MAADIDEYPMTYECQKRCVNMVSRLWHAPLGPEEGGRVLDCWMCSSFFVGTWNGSS